MSVEFIHFLEYTYSRKCTFTNPVPRGPKMRLQTPKSQNGDTPTSPTNNGGIDICFMVPLTVSLWQYGLSEKRSNEEVSDKKAAKFSNPWRVLSQIRKLSSRHFPHLIGFSLPFSWTFSACCHWWWWWWWLVIGDWWLVIGDDDDKCSIFVAYLKCLVRGKIQLHKVNAIAGIGRVSENYNKDNISEFKTKG